MLQRVRVRQRGVQLQVGEVAQPHERRQVLAQAVVDLALGAPAPHGRGLDPVGAVGGALLLIEVLPLHAVRIALERQRPVAQVPQQHRRDLRVVVDQLGLREAGVRVEHLLEVRQPQRAPVELDLLHPTTSVTRDPRDRTDVRPKSGRGGIRTPVGGKPPETVFETAAFNHSATLPPIRLDDCRCPSRRRTAMASRFSPARKLDFPSMGTRTKSRQSFGLAPRKHGTLRTCPESSVAGRA